jgi:hypothetical protein
MMALRTKLNAIPTAAPAPMPAPLPAEEAQTKSGPPPSRRDKAQVAFFVSRTTKRQLETIAFNEQRKLQSLMLEACNMLFQSRGMTRTEE